MRRSLTMVFAAALMAAPMVASAQGAPAADEQSRSIKDGGVKVAGWKGMIDANEAKKGLAIENAKLRRRVGELAAGVSSVQAGLAPRKDTQGSSA